jgi:hypothetical protein
MRAQQRPREPFHLDSLERSELLRGEPWKKRFLRHASGMWTRFSKAQNLAIFPSSSRQSSSLVINLKAAKQIGRTIPPNVLLRADKVIK